MNRKFSILSVAGASTNMLRETAPLATIVMIAVAVAAGCAAHRCDCARRCARPATPCCQPSLAPDCGAPLPAADTITAMTEAPVVQPALPLRIAPDARAARQPHEAYGHGESYEWLIGRLQRVHVPRKGWKIRYAPIDRQDRWGGSMVLAPDIRLEKFADGDTIYVEGDILGDRASLYLSGPRYRIRTVRAADETDVPRVARDDR